MHLMRDLPQYISLALIFSFSLFIACTCVFFISFAYLMLFKITKANRVFGHPYLEHQAFANYPFSVRMAMVLDYFLRIVFPKARTGLAGNANRLLAGIDPKDIPTDVKWPIIGLWGGCAVGMVAMITLWILLMAAGGR